MISDQFNRFLKIFAIVGALSWFGYALYQHFAQREPGDLAYLAGNTQFKDSNFKRAAEDYRQALSEDPGHTPAMRGLANSLIQLKRYKEALALMDKVVAMEPDFGGNYAIRGIVNDYLGNYQQAVADYQKGLALDKKIADGMHWLDRLLRNVQTKPPTVADRLRYLKAELAKPESERLMRVPELDQKQRGYEQ